MWKYNPTQYLILIVVLADEIILEELFVLEIEIIIICLPAVGRFITGILMLIDARNKIKFLCSQKRWHEKLLDQSKHIVTLHM